MSSNDFGITKHGLAILVVRSLMSPTYGLMSKAYEVSDLDRISDCTYKNTKDEYRFYLKRRSDTPIPVSFKLSDSDVVLEIRNGADTFIKGYSYSPEQGTDSLRGVVAGDLLRNTCGVETLVSVDDFLKKVFDRASIDLSKAICFETKVYGSRSVNTSVLSVHASIQGVEVNDPDFALGSNYDFKLDSCEICDEISFNAQGYFEEHGLDIKPLVNMIVDKLKIATPYSFLHDYLRKTSNIDEGVDGSICVDIFNTGITVSTSQGDYWRRGGGFWETFDKAARLKNISFLDLAGVVLISYMEGYGFHLSSSLGLGRCEIYGYFSNESDTDPSCTSTYKFVIEQDASLEVTEVSSGNKYTFKPGWSIDYDADGAFREFLMEIVYKIRYPLFDGMYDELDEEDDSYVSSGRGLVTDYKRIREGII